MFLNQVFLLSKSLQPLHFVPKPNPKIKITSFLSHPTKTHCTKILVTLSLSNLSSIFYLLGIEIMENPNNLAQNLKVLAGEMGALKQIRDEVARIRERQMKGWLQDVEAKECEVDEIQKEFGELKLGISGFNARFKLNGKVIGNLKAVKVLKEKGNAGLRSMETVIHEIEFDKPKRFSDRELKSFTSNFSNMIGSGVCGYEIYKGQLPNGQQIAVKVLANTKVVEDNFMAEVRTMGRTSHRYLAKLFGFCFEINMKAVVYEYMTNGSLDKILYGKSLSVEWGKLYAIVIQTAQGLAYLHEGFRETIIHHDIKPANVILDSNLSPKLTNFGLAKLMNRDLSHLTLTRTRGTPGYAAPEMWTPSSPITHKCDVYSFGMMLFEVLGMRRNLENKTWFPGEVWEKFENGRLNEILKACRIREEDKEKAKTLCLVAFRCTQFSPKSRPPMSSVIKMLEMDMKVEIPPRPFSSSSSLGEPTRELINSDKRMQEEGFRHRGDCSSSKPTLTNNLYLNASSQRNSKANLKKALSDSSRYQSEAMLFEASSQRDSKQNLKKVLSDSSRYQSETMLELFEKRCPPGGESSAIIYTSRLGNKLVTEKCNEILSILQSHQIVMIERDYAVNLEYKEELYKVLGIVKLPPILFVKGRYIGGLTAVKKLEKHGKLKPLLDGIPKE